MALSLRQKVFLATLALATAVMIVDRLFVLPKSAGAGETPKATTPGELVISMPNVPEPPAASASLARRLESTYPGPGDTEDAGRDAFVLSKTWHAALVPPPAPAPEPAQEALAKPEPVSPPPPPDPVALFEKQHHLTAVVLDRKTARALVDDRPMTTGQELDGFTLVSIQEDQIVFAAGPKQCVLRLAGDP